MVELQRTVNDLYQKMAATVKAVLFWEMIIISKNKTKTTLLLCGNDYYHCHFYSTVPLTGLTDQLQWPFNEHIPSKRSSRFLLENFRTNSFFTLISLLEVMFALAPHLLRDAFK